MSASEQPDWVPLSPSAHAGWNWQRNTGGLRFAAMEGLISVSRVELPHLLGQFVLTVQRASAEQWRLVALLSLQPDHNAYVDANGRWRAPYVPAQLRGYPFRPLPTQEGKQVACIDRASGLFDPNGQRGEPLWDSQGHPTQAVKEILDFMDSLARKLKETATLCRQLHDHSLLNSWQPEDPEVISQGHAGLYQLDEKAFRKLPPEALGRLNANGALDLAFALLFSRSRLDWLKRYHQQQASDPKVDLDKLLGEDDIFKF